MSALDLYVIRKVFEDYETLLNFSFVNRDNFTISINISGNSLNKSLFLEKVLNLCEEYNIENKTERRRLNGYKDSWCGK